MFKLQLEIQVDVLNYDEVVKSHKGQVVGSVINWVVPDKRLGNAVDAQIAKQLSDELPARLSQSLAQSLEENGVRAEVAVTVLNTP